MLYIQKKNQIVILLVFEVLFATSCKKFIEVGSPVTKIDAKAVYDSDASAIAVLNGVYSESCRTLSGTNGISVLLGLTADELDASVYAQEFMHTVYTNSINPKAVPFWDFFYNKIYISNVVIEGLEGTTRISNDVKSILLGEAKFMRAFNYFYLVNLFGSVPLIVKSDYHLSISVPRTDKSGIYEQIIKDLKDAQSLLPLDYMGSDLRTKTPYRVRPNKDAANALLARVYLYTKNWDLSEKLASTVINRSDIFQLEELDKVFLSNSKEAILQWQPVDAGFNTLDGRAFILLDGPNTVNPVLMSDLLYSSFERNDKRKEKWIGTKVTTLGTYHFSYKYRIGQYNANQSLDEYLMVLRLGEQYLIRAEANAHLGKLSLAIEDLNKLRQRAGLTRLLVDDLNVVLNEIEHERQTEMFCEFGHRWLDIKRTDKANQVMGVVTPSKGGVWSTNLQLFPIPINDILSNSNLSQNEGY